VKAVVDGHKGPEALLAAAEEREALRRRLERLDRRERSILTWRYGLGGESPMTLKEIGHRLGVSEQWIQVVARGALGKLLGGLGPDFDPIDRRRPCPPRDRGSAPPGRAAHAPSPDPSADPVRPLPHPTRGRRASSSLTPDPGYLARCG
jgi:hypothetical protein